MYYSNRYFNINTKQLYWIEGSSLTYCLDPKCCNLEKVKWKKLYKIPRYKTMLYINYKVRDFLTRVVVWFLFWVILSTILYILI